MADPTSTDDPSVTDVAKQDCVVDEDKDHDDPNNLFTCLETEECCTVSLKPACCATREINEEL